MKSQAKRRICWSPRIRNRLGSSLLACFWISAGHSNTRRWTHCASFYASCSSSQALRYGNTGGTTNKHYKIRLDSFLYLYSTPIAPLIKGNNPQNTFQVVWMSVCVGGWLQEGWGGGVGSFYSYFPLRQIFLNSFHITYQSFCVCVPAAGSCPNPLHKRRRL